MDASAPEQHAAADAAPVGGVVDDLLAPEVVADPYAVFGELRRTEPVSWVEGAQAWIATRYRDVYAIIRDHDGFSSAIARDPRNTYPPVAEEDRALDADFREFIGDELLFQDRPAHREMRHEVRSWFTPKVVERWRGEVRRTVEELLERGTADDSLELKEDVATPLPIWVVCRLLGVPVSDGPALRALAHRLEAIAGPGADKMKDVTDALAELQDYFAPIVDARAKEPRDDLISAFADGERRGVFTRRQVFSNVVLFMEAGHETTINLICNSVLAFARNPAQWTAFLAGPATSARDATEECLRYEPPIKMGLRICTREVELGGRRIAPGERVLWCISSANRDPEVFEQPDTFDIGRTPNPHVAFGGGIHHCLGAALSRLEGQEVLMTLAAQFPDLPARVDADDVEFVEDWVARSVQSLPLRVGPPS